VTAPESPQIENLDGSPPPGPEGDSPQFTHRKPVGPPESAGSRGSDAVPHFLMRASQLLAQSLDYETTLLTVTGMALPYLGSWCIVDVLEPSGAIRRLGIVHPDPLKREYVERLKDSWPPDRADPLGVPRVILTQATEVIPHVADEVLAEVARSEENLRHLRALGIGSVVVVPLVARDAVLGAITFCSPNVGHHYTEPDVQLAEDLAGRCAIAVDNARLFRDMTAARREAEEDRYRTEELNERLVVARIREQQLAEQARDAMLAAQRALTAAELSEQRFSRIIAIAAEAIISVDETQRIILFNEGAEQIFGYRKGEILGQPLALLLPEEFRAVHENSVRAFGESPEVARRMGHRKAVAGRRKDGETIPVEASISKLEVAGERVYTVVLRDTSEATKDAQARENLLLAVTQATEARTRLIRGVTHDVKNPLGAADGFAALLEMEVHGSLLPEQARLVAGVRRCVHGALAMITDLLSLSGAESGTLQVNREAMDLAAATAEALEDYRGAAEAAGHEVVWAANGPVTVRSDPTRVREVLGNLLSNAIKYTPPPGRITVWIERVADDVNLGPGEGVVAHVRDTGPGIPPDERETIFGEFHRLHSSEQGGGHGLGLAISRLIVRLLDGELTVSGEAGEGATFSLWLPVAGPPS